MAIYIVDRPAHVTYYRYIVEADSEEEAEQLTDEPFGYFDEDAWGPKDEDGDPVSIFERVEYDSVEDAEADTYVEYRL